MGVLQNIDQNRGVDETHNYDLTKNFSSNKFRMMVGANQKENKYKYSLLQSSTYNKEFEGQKANKTPSHNSRLHHKNTVKPQMSKPPGEESNPYYKTQQRNHQMLANNRNDTSTWKNMTHQGIFEKDAHKVSGVSPSSTKNCTSKYMKFNLGRENKVNPQMLELPSGLKDLEESDLEVEDYEENNDQNTFEELSLEDNNPKCFTKSKIESLQSNFKDANLMNKMSAIEGNEIFDFESTNKVSLKQNDQIERQAYNPFLIAQHEEEG